MVDSRELKNYSQRVKAIRFSIGMIFCLGCQPGAPSSGGATRTASSSTVSYRPDTTDTSSFAFPPDPVDSNAFSWSFAPAHDYLGDSRFTGEQVRHPSGLLLLWFDTATRATEDKPTGRVHVDTLAVWGLKHGEFATPHCNTGGRWESQIVGVVHDSTGYSRPRLAWLLDTASNKIRAIATDSLLCTPGGMFGGDVD
jgi:hypothetical protein